MRKRRPKSPPKRPTSPKAVLPLAVTGGIAEGKSTVLEVLRLEGLHVVSADAVVGELWQSEEVLSALAELFEMEGLPTKASVLAAIAENADQRRQLQSFMHPLVWDQIKASQADAVEMPLLYEACLSRFFGRVWVVTCGPEIQKQRLTERVGEALATKILATQLPTRVKCAFADEVVRTNWSLEAVHTQTRSALQRHRGR